MIILTNREYPLIPDLKQHKVAGALHITITG